MRLIRATDTKPEMAVRRLVHSMGYRYRLHCRQLPGAPDLVFAARKKVIFVHGCFWHQHARCNDAKPPRSRLDYWQPKLEKNRRRDRANQRKIRAAGWDPLILWECQLKDLGALSGRLREFLEGRTQPRRGPGSAAK